jgi:3-dehydroquinate synthetase
MELDKKSSEGKIKFICCTGVGGARFHWLSPEEIVTALASNQQSIPGRRSGEGGAG